MGGYIHTRRGLAAIPLNARFHVLLPQVREPIDRFISLMDEVSLSLASPRLASPRLASPRLTSPRLASPRLAYA